MFYLVITVYDVSRRGGRVVISVVCLTPTVRVMLGFCGTMAGLSGHFKLSQELFFFSFSAPTAASYLLDSCL